MTYLKRQHQNQLTFLTLCVLLRKFTGVRTVEFKTARLDVGKLSHFMPLNESWVGLVWFGGGAQNKSGMVAVKLETQSQWDLQSVVAAALV